VAALRATDRYEARPLLRELEELLRAGARIEAPCWTAALFALGDPRLRDPGRALTALLLERDGEPPPDGYAALAEALDEVGDDALATSAWRRAAARREPGSRERLATRLRWRGWQAAEAGETERALELLREAKRLAKSG
jgi:tetratricopeptide (TPR) repeat protein